MLWWAKEHQYFTADDRKKKNFLLMSPSLRIMALTEMY